MDPALVVGLNRECCPLATQLTSQMSAVAFASHTLLFGQRLAPSDAFVALIALRQISNALDALGFFASKAAASYVSLRRIESFLATDETPAYEPRSFCDGDERLGFENGRFRYRAGAFELNTGSLVFPPDRLTLRAFDQGWMS